MAPTGSGKTLAYVLPTLVRLGDPARSFSESSAARSSSASEKRDKGKKGIRAEEEDTEEREEGEGKGIRALIVVPTHDLAVQIEGVVKAVTRKRGWRCIVLSKATEKAVCESSPRSGGGKVESVDEEEDVTGKTSGGLGIDILIATPERLHHLLEEGKISLAL